MRGYGKWLAFSILVLVVSAAAETSVEVHGQVRARSQLDKKSFDSLSTAFHFFELRTRVGATATVDDNAHAFIQLQDSRMAGGLDRFGQPTSGTLNDGKNVDMHQAFIKVDRIAIDGLGAMAGRFEFIRGNERIFGAVGWDNVGRTWDGSMAWYRRPDFSVTGFWLKRLELNDPNENRDFDVFGIYVTINRIQNSQLDLFGFYEYDADTIPALPTTNLLNRGNLGLYFKGNFEPVDFEANGVVQLGTMPRNPALLDATELDIQALLIAAELGYTFPGEGHARLAAGIDYSSGDDDPSDDKFESYQNSYYTSHNFRGYMDYFASSDIAGLMDLLFRARVDPATGWTLQGDFHYFQTAADYLNSLDSQATSDVGFEIDLVLSTVRVPGLQLDAGVSGFFAEDAFAATVETGSANNDPGFWFWSMATINFGK